MTLLFLAIYFILIVLFGLTLVVNIVTGIPYVPSRSHIAKRLIDQAKLKKGETVFDLGSGDGRLLIEAAKTDKVQGIGFEIAPLVHLLAVTRRLFSKNRKHIDLRFKNMFDADLKKADVIFCYLMPKILPRVGEKIKKECKKGTRVISNTFKIPGLKLKKHVPKKRHFPSIYVYEI